MKSLDALSVAPASPPVGEALLIPAAAGDLVDKLTILEIKQERIADAAKLAHVAAELAALRAVWRRHGGPALALDGIIAELKAANEALWVVEDDLRDCERRLDFGPRFIALARSVYRHNDRRFALKRRINELAGSAIVEEKSYKPY